VFDGRRAGGYRDTDVQSRVGQQTPEHGMGNVVEILKPEQGKGTQPGNPRRSFIDKTFGQQPGLHQRRADQGIQPDEESGHQSRQGSGRRTSFPQDAPEDGRRELGHGGKRNQADGHQGVVFADKMKVGVAEHQNQ